MRVPDPQHPPTIAGGPAALAAISRELAEAGLVPAAVLDLIVERCAALLGDVCLVRTISADRSTLVAGPAAHRDPAALGLVQELLGGDGQSVTDGVTGGVVRSGEAMLLLGGPIDPSVIAPAYRRYVDERGIASMMLAPLVARGEVLGVVHLSRDGGSPAYTENERDLFLDLVERAALAYDNARLYREVAARGRLIDRLDAAVVALDADGCIASWNPAAERLFGRDAASVLGRRGMALLSAEYPPTESEAARAEAFSTGWEGEWEMVRADGAAFPAWARVTPLHDDRGEVSGVVGVFTDLSAERRSQELLARRSGQHETVALLGERALEGGDPQVLLQQATAEAARALGGRAVLLQAAAAPGTFVVRHAAGFADDPVGEVVPSGQTRSLTGCALARGRGVLSRAPLTDERFELEPFLAAADPGAAVAVVVQGHDRPHAVLVVVAPRGQPFTPADVRFLQSLANVLADAIDRWRAEDAQRQLALHDPLTGLPNRTLVLDRIGHALTRIDRTDGLLAILFLDLDHFKVINDGLGHGAGDELLSLLAPRLRSAVRPPDTVGRFGGDEFVVVCEAVRDEAMALAIARRVTEACAAPFRIAGQERHVSLSVGVVVTDGHDARPGGLLRDADAAMYRAKDRGRSRVELFDTGMRARAVERMQIERELRRGIERDELRVFYQPIVDLRTGQIAGCEALVRWEHPDRGLLQPAQFIHIAEECGLIVPLGRHVLERACAEAASWPAGSDGAARLLHVNLSAQQVTGSALVELVDEVLARTRMPAGRLVLEITETALLERGPTARDALERLTACGIRISLDDFGTGYSALGYLERFPIGGLKIDRSFVDGLGVHAEKRPIVDAILRMAEALGLDVVAEGLELPQQLTALTDLGCPSAQGHLFARPMDAGRLTRLLADGDVRLPVPEAPRAGPGPAAPGKTAGPGSPRAAGP